MIPHTLKDQCTNLNIVPQSIRFPSSDPKLFLGGVLLEAPANSAVVKFGRAPIIVMAPGFGETVEFGELVAFASRFNLQLGIHVLMFDNRSFGMSEGMPRHIVHTRNQFCDWICAMQFAKSLPFVDSDKIILWGASIAGGHVIELSTMAPVFLSIAQVPLINAMDSGIKSLHESSVLSHFKFPVVSETPAYVTVKGVVDRHPVIYAEEDVFNGRLIKMTGIGSNTTFTEFNKIVCRTAFSMTNYNPTKHIHKLKSPLLYQFGQYDQISSSEKTKTILQRVNLQFMNAIPYSGDHFLGYAWNLGGQFDAIVQDQLQFVQVHLVEAYGAAIVARKPRISIPPRSSNSADYSALPDIGDQDDDTMPDSKNETTMSSVRQQQQAAYQKYIASSTTPTATPLCSPPPKLSSPLEPATTSPTSSVIVPPRTVSLDLTVDDSRGVKGEPVTPTTPKRSTSLSTRSRSVVSRRGGGSGNSRDDVGMYAYSDNSRVTRREEY
ncbi:Alpha/Beta hydrolase protein [Chytriomyces cf. hyalinus JEL632]|nr:Alpha/Beta hydrolase protein [Chytriomyces cf. hyalinus JEL632]